MGRTCGTYGAEGQGGETRGKRNHLEDLGVDGMMILNGIFKNSMKRPGLD